MSCGLQVNTLRLLYETWNFAFVIRTATENDRDVWVKLRTLVYTDCSDEFHHEDVNLWLRDDGKACFLKEVDGSVVGFLEASLRNVVDGCLTSPVGYMEGICIFPEFRGRGYSKELISAAEDWMKAEGCTEMGSDSELENESAIQFHKANGFDETYRIVQFKKKL